MRNTLLAAGAILAATASSAFAADHTNLESNLPVVIEDAYVTPYNSIEAQGFLRYDRAPQSGGRNEGDRLWFAPRAEWGAAENLQLTLETPYRVGNASETGQGDVTLSALYNFNNEGRFLPAIALGGGASTNYGYQNDGTEVNVEFAATKSLGSVGESYVPRRLSVNAIYYRNVGDRAFDGRKDRYRIGAAYAQPVTNDLVMVADLYRETDRTRGEAENVAEIGGRYQFDPQTVISAGLGAGAGDRSPDFRILIGFQHALSFPAFNRP